MARTSFLLARVTRACIASSVIVLFLATCSPAAFAEPSTANGLASEELGYVTAVGGLDHSIGLKADGTVWTWGDNFSGDLGIGTTVDSSTPVQVTGIPPVRQVAAGDNFSMVLGTDGTVWGWGRNVWGQLGDGSTTDRLSPVQIASLTGARQLVAEDDRGMVIKQDGTVWAWGNNTDGKLGDGTTTQRNAPVQIPSITGARSLSLGGNHSMAIMPNGEVWAWGSNYYGTLGNGGDTTSDEWSPVEIPALAGTRELSLGQADSMAIKQDGTVWVWGANINGSLGDGTTTERRTPVQLSALTGARSIASGRFRGMVILADGSVWSWGGQALGTGGASSTVPVEVVALQGARKIDTSGSGHSFAITATGQVLAWGENAFGQLGDGTQTARPTPTASLFQCGCGFVKVHASEDRTMAVKADGTVWAWGANGSGQLGDGTTTQRDAPTQVPALAGVRQLALGETHGLAIKANGSVWAWGANADGQLGDGTTTQRLAPVEIPALAGARHVAAGARHSGAILADGSVVMWGFNGSGQLGLGDTSSRTSPTTVASLAGSRALMLGGFSSFALAADGAVRAFGSNANGMLADGTTTNRTSPTLIAALAGSRMLSSGSTHAFAIKSNGSVWGWGNNNLFEVGAGAATGQTTPYEIAALAGMRRVTAAHGGSHTGGIHAAGSVQLWGYNLYGQVGNGTTNGFGTSPTTIAAISGARELALGGNHSVALMPDGTLMSFGRNDSGQLGDGTTTGRLVPTAVDAPCAAPPATPVNATPASGTTSALPTLTTGSYADPNGDAHQASQWQVRTNAGSYVAPFEDSGTSTTSLTSYAMTSSLTEGTTYWFRARHRDSTGLWSDWSTETAFVLDTSPPGVPTLVTPVDGAAVTSAALTATYHDPPPGSTGRVEFQVCSNVSCAAVAEAGASGALAPEASGTWSHTRASGTWYWRARGVDAAGSTSAWSATRSFAYNAPPAIPGITSPAAGAWVTTPEPALVATYSDPDSDPGRVEFELCRSDAPGPWSSVANCAVGYQSVASAAGASGGSRTATPLVQLGQGSWYLRARAIDAAGGTSAHGPSRLLRVDSLPPTRPGPVQVNRSGLGRITISWTASSDSGIGGVTYDVEWSSDGSTWSALCTNTASLSCNQSGLGGSSLPFVRVRACDGLDNCSTWQGRTGGAAVGYYLRTTVTSTVLTDAANRRATVTSGTSDLTTAQRIDSGETGWYQLHPGALSSLNPVASEPALVPAPGTGRGWIVHETAGMTLGSGAWALTVTTDSDQTGVGRLARIQCRAWVVTVTAGAISASSNAQSAESPANALSTGQQTHTCQLPGLATQQPLAGNQYVYVELYLRATTGGDSNNRRVWLSAEGTGSALSLPPPGNPPSLPNVTSPASGTVVGTSFDLVATYLHPTPVQGALEYEFATDAAFTDIVQVGTSPLLNDGQSSTMTIDAPTAGTRYLRVRARDVSDLVSGWTATRTIIVSSPPATPTHVAPAAGATGTSSTPTLQSSAFSDGDAGDAHSASEWQLAEVGYAWTTGQLSGVTGTALTSWSPAALSAGSYQWRVRHRDAHGIWSAWSAATTFTVSSGGSLTLTLDTTTVALGAQVPGVDDFGSFSATVATTNPSGYQLTALGAATGSLGASCSGCTQPVADWTGTPAIPALWSSGVAGYFGVTVRGATGGRLAKWGPGTGTTETDVAVNRYAGISDSVPTVLHDRSSAAAGDVVTATARINVDASTSAGTHSEAITVTATANP